MKMGHVSLKMSRLTKGTVTCTKQFAKCWDVDACRTLFDAQRLGHALPHLLNHFALKNVDIVRLSKQSRQCLMYVLLP